jgi:hypothetical protein
MNCHEEPILATLPIIYLLLGTFLRKFIEGMLLADIGNGPSLKEPFFLSLQFNGY